jgi:hypothetical protein
MPSNIKIFLVLICSMLIVNGKHIKITVIIELFILKNQLSAQSDRICAKFVIMYSTYFSGRKNGRGFVIRTDLFAREFKLRYKILYLNFAPKGGTVRPQKSSQNTSGVQPCSGMTPTESIWWNLLMFIINMTFKWPTNSSFIQVLGETIKKETDSDTCDRGRWASTCEDPISFDLNYRTFDGKCTNLRHREWGSNNRPYIRVISAKYNDGLDESTGTVEPGYKSPGYKSYFVYSRAQYYAITQE